MVKKLTLNSLSTAMVDIPSVSMPITRSLKTRDIRGILCDKTAHLKLALYCLQHQVHLCNDHDNQFLDMPHLSGGWIILENDFRPAVSLFPSPTCGRI